MTWTDVENVEGYIGNFTVTVKKKARYVDTTLVQQLRFLL